MEWFEQALHIYFWVGSGGRVIICGLWKHNLSAARGCTEQQPGALLLQSELSALLIAFHDIM